MKAHGRWSIKLVRNVVLQYYADSFNEEGSRARFADLEKVAPTAAPWVTLNNSLLWTGAGKGAMQLLQKHREWMFVNGCRHSATVVSDQFYRHMLAQHGGSFSSEQLRYFLSLEEACAWLGECGFPIRPDELPPPDWANS